MNKLILLWKYLDGKKTAIGAAILLFVQFVGMFDEQVLTQIWGIIIPAYIAKILTTLTWIGNGFAGIGLLHKGNKLANSGSTIQPPNRLPNAQ